MNELYLTLVLMREGGRFCQPFFRIGIWIVFTMKKRVDRINPPSKLRVKKQPVKSKVNTDRSRAI